MTTHSENRNPMKISERRTVQNNTLKNRNFHVGPSQGQQQLSTMSI